MDHEIRALGFGVDPSNMAQFFINKFNRNFFKIVQLERLTNYARAKAYDAGIFRSHDIAKKFAKTGTISKSLRNEINALGLDENSLRQIAKFDTPNAAYEDDIARVFLHKAGFKSAERDAIIPTMGNRLHFAQSNNPAIRAMGQFISWAQAKTTQTNALLTRVEDGDLRQAIRILGALTIYGGVRELQIAFSPSSYYDDEENVPERFSKEWIGESIVLSGNVPVQIDKLFNSFAGPGAVSPVTSIVPVLALMEDLAKTPPKVINNAWNDDYWGATSNVTDVLPFGKDVKNVLRKLGIVDISDEPNIQTKNPWERAAQVTGGLIEGEEEVPYAKEKPEERINPFTGEPYTALYYNGGRVRKGFGGKLLKKLVPTSKKDVEKNVRLFLPSRKMHEAATPGLTEDFREVWEEMTKNPKDNIDRLTYNPNNPMYKPAVVPDIPVGQGDTSLAMEALSAVSLEQSLPYHGILSRRKNFKQGEKVNVEEGSDDKKELNVVKEAIESNNAGNIEKGQGYAGEMKGKYYGENDRFVYFDTPQAGVRGIKRDTLSKLKEFNGDVFKMISKYAPAGKGKYGVENPTGNYYKYLLNSVGNKEIITREDIPNLVRGIIEFENLPRAEESEEQKLIKNNRVKNYLSDEVFNEAMVWGEYDYPTGTTSEQMREDQITEKFRTE